MTNERSMEENNKADYRDKVSQMGKKEFTLLKMQEYGFWPKHLPTPYERQKNETPQQYEDRKKLLKDYQQIVDEINQLYNEKDDINKKLRELRKEYDQTWDYDKIRLDIGKQIMKESIARRKERKEQKEREKNQRSQEWNQKVKDEIVFIGDGYSGGLEDKIINEEKLLSFGLPIITTDVSLADFLEIDLQELRFLTYHRDVVTMDHYYRYEVPKKKGGFRKIAAPKTKMKFVQRKILDHMLSKIQISEYTHGFMKERSVISGANAHITQPELLINMDLEDFFPTITFERVRGMFKSFGYSGYIASLLAMICTYCDRVSIEVRGSTKYVKTSERILPQGSPASPMITNIICLEMDKRLNGLAKKYGFTYSRYADDMSFSTMDEKGTKLNEFCGLISKIIMEEGFTVNKNKTKFLRKNNCQSITGIVINNEQIGVSKKWIKRLRAAIHNANQIKLKEGKVPQSTIYEISGMIAWIKSVNEERYQSIIEEAKKIIQ